MPVPRQPRTRAVADPSHDARPVGLAPDDRGGGAELLEQVARDGFDGVLGAAGVLARHPDQGPGERHDLVDLDRVERGANDRLLYHGRRMYPNERPRMYPSDLHEHMPALLDPRPSPKPEPGDRLAAVLIPMVGDEELVFTRRTEQ